MKKTRGLILIVLTIVSILVGGTTVKAADYTAVGNLTSNTNVLEAGSTVTVSFNLASINVGDNAGINAMQATVEKITSDSCSGSNGWSPAYNQKLVLARMSGCTTSTEPMVTITFKTLSDISATETTITLKDITVAGTSGSWSSGNITIEPVSVKLSASNGSGSGSQDDDSDDPNGPGSGSGSGTGSGNSSGSGSDDGTGSGNGSGSGSGSGTGSGNGSDDGTGSGNGSGSGSDNGTGSGDGLNGANGSDGTTSSNSIPAAGVNKVVLSAIFVVAVIGAVGYFLYARLKKEIK